MRALGNCNFGRRKLHAYPVAWLILTACLMAAEDTAPSKVDELKSIADFRISVEEGQSADMAAVINLFPTRKSRRINGSIYEFHRNDNLDARNFFDPVGAPLPEFKRNQFGFNLGGVFLSDRLTLLGSFDGLRIVRGSTLLNLVPTPAQKRGDFSSSTQQLTDPLTGLPFPGNRIPDNRIDPAARAVLAVLPDPNRSDPDRNFVNNQPEVTDQNSFSVRANYRINNGAKIFGDYFFDDNSGNRVQPLPTFQEIRTERNQRGSISFEQTRGARLTLLSRVFFLRRTDNTLSINSGRTGLLASLGIEGVAVRGPEDEGFPQFDVTGYANFGDRNSPDSGIFNLINLTQNVSYAADSHTLVLGVNFDYIEPNNHRSGRNIRGRFNFTGSFSGDAFADFLLGIPNTASRATGSDRIDLRGRRLSLFVRDQWRINSRFDLTLGLRYSSYPAFRSVRDNISTFAPLLLEPPLDGQLIIPGTPEAAAFGLNDSRTAIFGDHDNFSPNIALAYSPRGNSSLVLRASYQIFHRPTDEGRLIRDLGRNFPFFFIETAQSPNETPQLSLSQPFRNLTPTELNLHGISQHLQSRRMQDWQFTLQTEFIRRWILDLSYRGNRGTRLTRSLPANIPLPGEGALQPRRPNPAFGAFRIVTDGGASTRHGFEVALNRRLSDGFSLRAEFEWNKVLTDTARGLQNPRNLRAERGLADQPLGEASINYIWDLPFGTSGFTASRRWLRSLTGGWRLTGATRFATGRPFSVLVNEDINNDGLSRDRPDLIETTNPNFRPSVDQFFDVSRFASPSGDFGNAGRNILFGPSRQTWDISLSKRIRISDSDALELRLELFNAFNNVNFRLPENRLGTSVFGTIFNADRSREIEIALKYSF